MRISYLDMVSDLRREGFRDADIHAAFDSLAESGMQASDESGDPVGDDELTTDEAGVIREQLEKWRGNEDCAYCSADMGHEDIPTPKPDDDHGWAIEAERHSTGCEWVETRAFTTAEVRND